MPFLAASMTTCIRRTALIWEMACFATTVTDFPLCSIISPHYHSAKHAADRILCPFSPVTDHQPITPVIDATVRGTPLQLSRAILPLTPICRNLLGVPLITELTMLLSGHRLAHDMGCRNSVLIYRSGTRLLTRQ